MEGLGGWRVVDVWKGGVERGGTWRGMKAMEGVGGMDMHST